MPCALIWCDLRAIGGGGSAPVIVNSWERGAAATAAGGGLALPWGLGRLAPAGEPSPDGGPEAGGTSIDPPSWPSCR